ncbi:hypothetical protein H2203_008308 [Taxawa tesnikishii (nom. ined.)]|nr:hypothetical protein H2203_008308 [Dothideales sp. JES 119]
MIPINLEDEHERDILHKQREICGWNKEKIPQWREQMAKGERTLFWVTLPKDYRPPEGGGGGGGGGSRAGINDLRRPLDGFGRPDEDTAAPTTTTSLEDLATLPRIRRARRRTSHGEGEEEQQQEEEEERLPVGHVSLDRVDRGEDGTEPDTSLASGDGRVLTLTALFVLPAFKALRLGAFAMDECEAMAQQSPYGNPNCEAITVHTMSPRHLAGGAEQGHWAKLGLQVPKRDNSVWYKRRGMCSTRRL